MTLKEKFDNVEIMFENQIGSLKYDELSETSNHCVKIADEFAIGFAKWCLADFYISLNSLFIDAKADTMEELLEIYKKEKGL